MAPSSCRYAVGVWPSLWACAPHMSHRLLIDLGGKVVMAGQDRIRTAWQPMTIEHVDYMQQIIEENFDHLFDDCTEYGFVYVDEWPQWARSAWPWPRPQSDLEDGYAEHTAPDEQGIDGGR